MRKTGLVARRTASFSAIAGTALAATLASSTGCAVLIGLDDFSEGSSTSSGGGGPSTNSASSSTSSGAEPACTGTADDILSPSTIAKFVNDDCGVFVRADAEDMSGDGTKDKPFRTVQAAIDGAKGKAIFMCAHDPFAETITVAE